MLCPHCKIEIEITNKTITCPLCKGDIELDVKNQLIAQDCMSRLVTDADKSLIRELLSNGQRKEAMHHVRKIRGMMDALVEMRVLRLIEQEDSNELVNKQKSSMKESAARNNLISCSICNQKISFKAETCPHCGNPTGVHVCPKCNSINTKVISGASKAASIFLWGAFAANKVVSKFECKDCGHKF